jgi:prepilin-type N-terminal cleavage/methylation domain-containing protein
MIGKTKNQQSGFTLMEMLISMSIFVLITMSVLSIHTTILHNSQQVLVYNRVQQESQYIMQFLAKKIRTSRVNYDYTDYQSQILDSGADRIETSALSIIDAADTEFVFFLDEATNSIKTKAKEDGGEYSSDKTLTSSDVDIQKLTFLIEPKEYPFSIDEPPETQPRVTMVMSFGSSKAQKTKTLTIQQTVSQLSGGVIPEE